MKLKFLFLLLGMLLSANLHADPVKVTVFVGGPAGGALDNVARILKDRLERHSSNTYNVDVLNRPGNGPVAATAGFLNNTRPTQHNEIQLLLVASSVLIPIYMQDTLPSDATQRLVPLTIIGKMRPIIHANLNFPIDNFKDIDKLGKSFITYTTPGNSTTLYMIAHQIQQHIKTPMIHVPVNSTPNALNMLLGNHVDLVFDVGQYYNMAETGKTKIVSVISDNNWSKLPNDLLLKNQVSGPVEFDLSYYVVLGNNQNNSNIQQMVGKDIKELAASDPQFLNLLANLNIESLSKADIHRSEKLWDTLLKKFKDLAANIKIKN
jgi:tripartite-type tricarboxylate transporter receptor subunit TctC